MHKALVAKMLVGVVFMFVFAVFAMPPLYRLACDALGIGPQQYSAYEEAAAVVDESRTVKVQFMATNQANMPWIFKPAQFEVVVHPGERAEVAYYAKNTAAVDMVAQAVPSVVPINAVDYLHKIECFCFEQQPLAAGEEVDMKLVFFVDPELPESIGTITLSYSVFDITSRISGSFGTSLNSDSGIETASN
jgi:cytochrome c oxidase assembly protein subunit 11